MPGEINHWCVLCGKGYHACDSCSKSKAFTSWRVLTDTPAHYQIFMILKDYHNHIITGEEARNLLSDLDLSDRALYKESARKVLDDIMGT
ncbi:MAG: hypothetical protein NC079_00605 [Clostridium sp.]|nr:hypothetical protein [Acetatifactor muris]MCM1527463.1 hypothetical protein [Bacteroides sp.]MCM1562091.1 hypothetical protein [Clostridium sp.]